NELSLQHARGDGFREPQERTQKDGFGHRTPDPTLAAPLQFGGVSPTPRARSAVAASSSARGSGTRRYSRDDGSGCDRRTEIVPASWLLGTETMGLCRGFRCVRLPVDSVRARGIV